MMRYFYTLLFFCLTGLFCLQAQTYKRIVSLAPSITNCLYLLDAQDQLVGRTQYCTMAEKSNIPVVADAVNVNIEKIVSLKPDLVIASGLTHPRIISAIEKMGIRTVHWHQPANFNELCEQFEEVGEFCGKKELAARYVDESRKRLANLPKQSPSRKVFMFLGSNPLYTVLPDSFMNDYIVLCGNTNIFSDLKTGVISRETVLLRNPDVIIAVSELQQEIDHWKKYTTINAVKNNRLFLIHPEKTSIVTPVGFMDILEKIVLMR